MTLRRSALLGCLAVACAHPERLPPQREPLHAARPFSPPASPPPSATPAVPAPPPPQLEEDGNDESAVEALVPERGHFEKVGRHWAALSRVCDFAVHGSALYLAHATRPLGLGGASITRYDPEAKTPFSLAFDWNRPGEPEKGGGSGQGFLRLRNIGGRIYAPDADPPYLGLGQAAPIEGYVFVSDARGAFPAARLPGHLPPRAPTVERGGASALPGAVHGFDVIRFRGNIYGSTSAMIPPNGSAPASPGALLTPQEDPSRPWRVAFTYAGASGEASVRLGYMTRFRDRLYVAISPLYGLDDHDAVVIAPPRDRATLEAADAMPIRLSERGRSHTLRWYTDGGKLYWIGVGPSGAALRVSEDGQQFQSLLLPEGALAATDLLRVGEHLLLLTDVGLYELVQGSFVLRAPAPPGAARFRVDDAYCAAPLVAFGGAVYAGDQERGNLWRLVAD
ncbi:MAG: hypothetical protein EOO73_02425 [Myxococcales bacterium]|nr:MAG: hypothetical protein EOO73_02425 [Myxococcales bacterium]